jgi:hypothetical protein
MLQARVEIYDYPRLADGTRLPPFYILPDGEKKVCETMASRRETAMRW